MSPLEELIQAQADAAALAEHVQALRDFIDQAIQKATP